MSKRTVNLRIQKPIGSNSKSNRTISINESMAGEYVTEKPNGKNLVTLSLGKLLHHEIKEIFSQHKNIYLKTSFLHHIGPFTAEDLYKN